MPSQPEKSEHNDTNDSTKAFTQFVAGLVEEVDPTVDKMIALVSGQDSFDILAMARLYTRPLSLNDFQQSEQTAGWATATEVIALVLLGLDMPQVDRRPEKARNNSTSEVVQQLIQLSTKITQAATYGIMAKAPRSDSEPISRLAAKFASAETTVRGRQYEHISWKINQGILESGNAAEYLEMANGFTYDQIRKVNSAIRELISDRFIATRQKIADAIQYKRSPTEPRVETLSALVDLIGQPGPLWTFTAQDVSLKSGMDVSTTEKVLTLFSLGKQDLSPHQLIKKFVGGQNPLAGRSMVRKNGHYTILGGAINEDDIRRLVEQGLKSSRNWAKYDRIRAKFSEKETVEIFKLLLNDAEPAWFNFKYHAPSGNCRPQELDQSANINSVDSSLVESDALFIVDDVAFCIEVKAGEITAPARRGAPDRLSKHLTEIIEKAHVQASRLRELISLNGGVWSQNKKWLALPNIKEFHTIIVSLDDLGVLSLSADELVRHGLLQSAEMPWIVTLHDLVVVANILDRPTQFLTYLRRRTESEAARLIIAVDELDLLMAFVEGQLYFESNPYTLAEKFPEHRPPSTRAYRQHQALTLTAIEGFTDRLDAWVYAQEGKSASTAHKPKRKESEWLSTLLNALEEKRPPGWLRFGADLAGSSGNTVRAIELAIKKIGDQTRQDGRTHSVNFGGWSFWGCWTLVAATFPSESEADQSMLQEYTEARKYADRSDRALLMQLDKSGNLLRFDTVDRAWEVDERLQNLVRENRILDPKRAPSAIPPSAKGVKSKKRKKAGRKKHK